MGKNDLLGGLLFLRPEVRPEDERSCLRTSPSGRREQTLSEATMCFSRVWVFLEPDFAQHCFSSHVDYDLVINIVKCDPVHECIHIYEKKIHETILLLCEMYLDGFLFYSVIFVLFHFIFQLSGLDSII